MNNTAALPPIVRYSSRVLVLYTEGSVLLFRISRDFVEFDELWLAPGGGIDRGETAEQAARRELTKKPASTMPDSRVVSGPADTCP